MLGGAISQPLCLRCFSAIQGRSGALLSLVLRGLLYSPTILLVMIKTTRRIIPVFVPLTDGSYTIPFTVNVFSWHSIRRSLRGRAERRYHINILRHPNPRKTPHILTVPGTSGLGPYDGVFEFLFALRLDCHLLLIYFTQAFLQRFRLYTAGMFLTIASFCGLCGCLFDLSCTTQEGASTL